MSWVSFGACMVGTYCVSFDTCVELHVNTNISEEYGAWPKLGVVIALLPFMWFRLTTFHSPNIRARTRP